MTGLSGPLTRVDMQGGSASRLRVGTLARRARQAQSARGGLYGARRVDLTSVSFLAPIAACGIHKGESGDSGSVGAHHPWPKRNGVHEGLCKEQGALFWIEAPFGPDQHRKGSAFDRCERLERRGRWRSLIGEDQGPALIPI